MYHWVNACMIVQNVKITYMHTIYTYIHIHIHTRTRYITYIYITLHTYTHTEAVCIVLETGMAEIFGSELPKGQRIDLIKCKLAVFTWHGCTLTVKGNAKVAYVGETTPMRCVEYLYICMYVYVYVYIYIYIYIYTGGVCG